MFEFICYYIYAGFTNFIVGCDFLKYDNNDRFV